MIKSLPLRAFTVFHDAKLQFGKNLNVIVGENGAGKTHVLKLAYSILAASRMEMPLVAEGLRKLGMLARLIATGALLDKGTLFWDEPEANLNPKLIRSVAKSIVDLSAAGIQIFIATHSLFLLRELELQAANRSGKAIDARFFGLQLRDDDLDVEQGSSIDEIGSIAALDEELEQSQRYLEQDS
jgi:predicted ATPase